MSLILFVFSLAASWAPTRVFAEAESCLPHLTGDPVNPFTQRAIARQFAGESGPLVVEHMTYDHVWNRADVDILGMIHPRLGLMKIKGITMLVRPAGVLAKKIIRVSAGQMNTSAPHEHYAFDYFDGARYCATSMVGRSAVPEGLGKTECYEGFTKILERGRAVASRLPRYQTRELDPDEMVRLTHEHPVHESLVWSAPGRALVIDAPLNHVDHAAALQLSNDMPDMTFVVSAVTLNGLEYLVAFRNGYDVTVPTARKIMKIEKILRKRAR